MPPRGPVRDLADESARPLVDLLLLGLLAVHPGLASDVPLLVELLHVLRSLFLLLLPQLLEPLLLFLIVKVQLLPLLLKIAQIVLGRHRAQMLRRLLLAGELLDHVSPLLLESLLILLCLFEPLVDLLVELDAMLEVQLVHQQDLLGPHRLAHGLAALGGDHLFV